MEENRIYPRYLSSILGILFIFFIGCTKNGDSDNFVSILTNEVTEITKTSAMSGGALIAHGGTIIFARGICWNTSPNPTVNHYATIVGSGAGVFESTLTELDSANFYYLRAFAITALDTVYGNEVTFITPPFFNNKEIVAGAFHSLSLNNGKVITWGANNNGQLGDGTKLGKSKPSQVFYGCTQIVGGGIFLVTSFFGYPFTEYFGFSFAIRSDGSLWGWGNNKAGQIGNGSNENQSLPVFISSDFKTVDAGANHSLGIKSDGTLWAWGSNVGGQLGDGTLSPQSVPIQIGQGFVAIAAGGNHSLALKVDGSLWSWGKNSSGQLGNGTTNDKNIPEQIGTGYIAIDAGLEHSMALKTDGSLWTWGNNFSGQLGDGTLIDKLSPIEVGSDYIKIAAGGGHSLALKSNGILWAWGKNASGQLGNGTFVNELLPTQIGTDFSSISAGMIHSLALKTDGTFWAWGSNDLGQIGDNTTLDRNVPVMIHVD